MLFNKNVIEDETIVSTKIIKEDIKTNISNLKNNEIINGYRVSFDKNSKNNSYKESPNIFNWDTTLNNNQKINESSSSFNDEKNICHQNILPVINFFKCNEIYFKEKISKMNYFRKRSKNFIEKKYFAKKEEIDQNKINDILKDIELLKNSISTINTINAFNENIYFLRNKQQYLNKPLDLYNYEFYCKYIIIFKTFFIYR